MSWNKYFLVSAISIASLLQSQVYAEADKKDAATEGEKNYSGRQTEEWLQVQSQLTTLKGKVENQQKLVEDLILKKESQKGKDLDDTITALKEAHIEWIRLVEQFNIVNSQFQNKFPEKGAAVGRIYKRIDPSNIETLENKMTLDGRLKKLEGAIKRQYSKSEPKAEGEIIVSPSNPVKAKSSKAAGRKKATEAAAVEDPGHQVTDQIVLEK